MGIIGVHARNDYEFLASDYDAIKRMNLSWLKMMSQTKAEIFKRIKDENPDINFITRLYAGGFGKDHNHPEPNKFIDEMSPIIESLLEYCNLFQIHNEPNHLAGIEGWGITEQDAIDFTRWFILVYNGLKSNFPKCQFGFPGLAIPHNDIMWLEICKAAIEYSDWLGMHSYWQNPTELDQNHLDSSWGLRFIQYHNYYPDKDIYILEAGNSNKDNNYELNEYKMAEELVQWYLHIRQHKYIKAACPFILSSPDKTWEDRGFTWINSDDYYKQIIYEIEKGF